MSLSRRDNDHVFERLRAGLVPERGLESFAVGIDRPLAEVRRQLDLAAAGEGLVKFLRGGYGCGKTFMARVAALEAQRRGFATSFVVVSDNDLHFHKFDDVYRKAVAELATASCPRGALGDILDRWMARVESALIAAGADESAGDFDKKVHARLAEELASMTRGAAPEDFVRVVQTLFELKQEGDLTSAGSLLSWLSGSGNVGSVSKRLAGIKGDLGSREALSYLRGILEIVKAAGYAGLMIVIDEAETILRMRKDVRDKSLNGIRQICDAASGFPGLVWVFTGTPELFDTRRGVAGLTPLHDRIRFLAEAGLASSRQPQLELKPFDRQRLEAVALRLRELYPATDRTEFDRTLSRKYIQRLVQTATEGFGGDVGVVPRQFLRELVHRMDLFEEYGAPTMNQDDGFEPDQLTPEEALAQRSGMDSLAPAPVDAEANDGGLVLVEDVW